MHAHIARTHRGHFTHRGQVFTHIPCPFAGGRASRPSDVVPCGSNDGRDARPPIDERG